MRGRARQGVRARASCALAGRAAALQRALQQLLRAVRLASAGVAAVNGVKGWNGRAWQQRPAANASPRDAPPRDMRVARSPPELSLCKRGPGRGW